MNFSKKLLLLLSGGAAASPLLTDLVDSWSLDEASGNRTGSHAGIVLTDTNTVGSAAGIISNAGMFVRTNSERLTVADSAALSTGDIDFTIAGWVRLTTNSGVEHCIASKYSNASREWVLGYDPASSAFRFYVSSDGNGLTIQLASTFGAASTAAWYWVCAWHDATANTLNIQVNNGTVDSQSYSAGVFDGSGPFTIGARDTGNYMDGRIDEVNYWKRVLTADEKTSLYNGGSGLAYPF